MDQAKTYWEARKQPDGNYACPACNKGLKAKLSQSEKNPNRAFVGCSKDYGGCGVFGWMDEVWVPKFATKRPRTEGTNIIGPIAGAPNATDTRLAEIATKLDQAITSIEALNRQVAELQAAVKRT